METDRIITLLQAAVADGELADDAKHAIAKTGYRLLRSEGMADQIAANAAVHVTARLSELIDTTDVEASEQPAVARAMVMTYWDGLTLGMSVAALASEQDGRAEPT